MSEYPTKLLEQEFPSIRPGAKHLGRSWRSSHPYQEHSPTMTTGLEIANQPVNSASEIRPVIGKLAVDPQLEGLQRYPGNPELQYMYIVREEMERTKPSLEDFICNHMQDVIPDAQNVEIDKKAIKERLAKTTIVIRNLEDYRLVFHKITGINQPYVSGGFYYPTNRTINFSKAPKEATDRHVWSKELYFAAHEYCHAASSQTFKARAHRDPEPISSGFHKTGNASMFTWFNEAITDTIAAYYYLWESGQQQPVEAEVYETERALMERMTEVGGISTKTILEAYFEEPDLNASPGQRMPKWHALQAEFTQVYGPYFLKNLDVLISKYKQEGRDPRILLNKDAFGRDYFEQAKSIWQTKVHNLGFEKAKQEALLEDSRQAKSRKMYQEKLAA